MKTFLIAVTFAIGCALILPFIAAARATPPHQTVFVLCLVGFGLAFLILVSISIFSKIKERWLALLFVALLILEYSLTLFIGVIFLFPAAMLLIVLAVIRMLDQRAKDKIIVTR